MPICKKLADSLRQEYGERAESVYHAMANTAKGKTAISKCIKKHGSTEAYDWGFRKGGERLDPTRKRVSPGGVDVGALQKASRKYPQADVQKFRAMSPKAARLAIQQSSKKRPMELTEEEVEVFEAQARRSR